MIIFHDGLPRSGKSYEACVNQIIPALKSGRQVYAYIDGINHEKFSEVTGLTVERIKELLHTITEAQVRTVDEHVPNDCLVLLDELQDYFPAGKNQLSPGITKFVTQHGHRGIDIVAMGQDYRDCHMLWKRRIHTLIQFEKQDAVGRPNKYTWKAFKQQKESGKFVKLRSGTEEYNPKYFGLYKSHQEGVKDIDVINDDRTNIFKSSVFRIWLPAFVVVLGFAFWHLWGFFHGEGIVQTQATVSTAEPLTKTETQQYSALKEKINPQVVPPPVEYKAVQFSNYVDKYLREYRPRLAGLIVCKTDCNEKNSILAKIDFYDGDRIKESFGIKQLKQFGYNVTVQGQVLIIQKDGQEYAVTSWPLDVIRNVSQGRAPELRAADVSAPISDAL